MMNNAAMARGLRVPRPMAICAQRFALCSLLFAFCAVPPFAAAGQEDDLKKVHKEVINQIAQRDRELAEQEAELMRTRKHVAQLARQEKERLASLRASERKLSSTRSELIILGKNLDAVTNDIRVIQAKLKESEEALERRQGLLSTRLRTMSLIERDEWLPFLVAFGDVGTWLETWQGLYLVADQDRRLIREIDQRKQTIQKDRADLLRKESSLRTLQNQKSQALHRQEQERVEREKQVAAVQTEKKTVERLMEEKEQDQKNLKLLLDMLRQREAKVKEELVFLRKKFEEKMGSLPWPVDRKSVTEIRDFGQYVDPVTGTRATNRGVDLFTRPFETVRVVSGGNVVYADWHGTDGNMVVVEHGDYYTIYTHLADISVRLGQKLAAGAELGHAGNTGTLERDRAVLHFEIREGSQALPPMKWLKK